ncbi:hypothetical protein HYX13_00405 [Candidatus Woesearchaeota archaeon]|nr:hypothetical protein [Candidatus Woesearchaeota archaeon]
MCEVHDAERQEQLAVLQQKKGLLQDASKSYLEASSIYVLQAEMEKKDIGKNKTLLKKANFCYKKAKEMLGEKFTQELNAQELAQRTLMEGETHHHQDLLAQIREELQISVRKTEA